jgi:hypothetical protein
MDTRTLTTHLINETTATIKNNSSIAYSSKSGLANTYSVLGLIVSIETTKQRGWELYESVIRVGYRNHVGTPDGFSEWYNEYKTSLGTRSSHININNINVERHTASRLQEAHDIAVIAGESYVLTIINKYVELLFSNFEKEVITRQINELQSQLASL